MKQHACEARPEKRGQAIWAVEAGSGAGKQRRLPAACPWAAAGCQQRAGAVEEGRVTKGRVDMASDGESGAAMGLLRHLSAYRGPHQTTARLITCPPASIPALAPTPSAGAGCGAGAAGTGGGDGGRCGGRDRGGRGDRRARGPRLRPGPPLRWPAPAMGRPCDGPPLRWAAPRPL